MNFLKGFVDGLLTTDSEGNALKSRHSYDQDEQDNDSEGFNRPDSFQNRNFSNNNLYINNSISQLNDLYKNERDNCVNGLIVRYGEGCVQQLSQLLKSNYDTILTLSHQYQNNLLAFKDLNNKMESVASEQLKLKNENNNLSQQLNLLNNENFNLKSQLTHANLTIKSNENHISALNEVLRDNKNTFENMKNRCNEFYKFKSEIEDLKKKLSLAESHISMLKKERDEYWSDPNHVVTDEDYKKRLSQAFERQDRAIAVAKVMASQTQNQFKPEKDEFKDLNNNQSENDSLNELKLQVDKLEDENTHLKEINDRLHNMYADLNKNLKEVKTTYLKEAVESLTSLFPTRSTPIQLVFIQPTGVLDLDFDPSSLYKYSQSSKTESYQQYEQQHQQSQLHQSQQQQAHLQHQQYQPEQQSQQIHNLQTDLYGMNVEKKEENKKTTPKMNFRSKVIKYVTGLDGSPRSSKSSKEFNLVDLDTPKLDNMNYGNLEGRDVFDKENKKEKEKDNKEENNKEKEKEKENKVKSTSWNTDWDMFEEEEDNTQVDKENKDKDNNKQKEKEEYVTYKNNMEDVEKVVERKDEKKLVIPTDDSFDFILEEEDRLSGNNFNEETDNNKDNEEENKNKDNNNKEKEENKNTNNNTNNQRGTHLESNRNSEFSDFNTHDHFDGYEYDDLLKSIKGEQDNKEKEKENKEDKDNTDNKEGNGGKEDNKGKLKSSWDMDFDDEMFESDT